MLQNITNRYQSLKDFGITLSRIAIGYTFALHGTAKFFEFPISMTGGNGVVSLFSMYGLAGLLEIGFGLFFILGLFTRFSAFILSGLMASAYFIAHASLENWLLPIVNKGEVAYLFCFIFLIFSFLQPTKYSIDYLISKKCNK